MYSVDMPIDYTTQLQALLDRAATNEGTGRIVALMQPAYISAPVIVPPGVSVLGAGASRATELAGLPPADIIALPGFRGDAMLRLGGTGFTGQTLTTLTLDGSAAKSSATFSGIRADGIVRGVVMRDVSVQHVSDRGIHAVPVAGRGPYSWHLDNVQVMQSGMDGFRITGMTDSTFTGCRAIGAGRHGWWIDGCANSTWSQCRSEWSKGQGWNIVGGWGANTGAGGADFLACSTDRSNLNGFLISVTGTAPLKFTSCTARRDGRNNGAGGGGYAGFRLDGAACPIIIGLPAVYPGVDDDGAGVNSPDHGMRRTNSVWARREGGYIHAANHPLDEWVNNLDPGTATGTTQMPMRY